MCKNSYMSLRYDLVMFAYIHTDMWKINTLWILDSFSHIISNFSNLPTFPYKQFFAVIACQSEQAIKPNPLISLHAFLIHYFVMNSDRFTLECAIQNNASDINLCFTTSGIVITKKYVHVYAQHVDISHNNVPYLIRIKSKLFI